MNTQELRIGNSVSVKEVPCIIVAIGAITISVYQPVLDTQFEIECYDAKPIPLTEEWLEKFGLFKPWDQFYWTFNDKDLRRFELYWKEGGEEFYIRWSGAFIGYRKYVHELQNTFRWLTGKELQYSGATI